MNERSAAEAASDILRLELGERSYDIVVGRGLIDCAGESIAPRLGGRRLLVVSDKTVAGFHGARLEGALSQAGIEHHMLVIPPGEDSKSFRGLEDLLCRLLDLNCDRTVTLAAFGGGVVGDLTGFAASILLRGVDFIQIPTTLLAQVDSSVGGKTGINTRHGKNLIGSFHQPRLVLVDTDVTDSLPERERRAGYAEIVKYGLIDDAAFFEWLEQKGGALIAGDAAVRRQAVVTSCRAKARIVGADERERGARALLNLGHTFAHALEAENAYGPELLHGEAVAVGLVLAFTLSARLGLSPPDEAARIARHLTGVGLPASIADLRFRSWSAESLMNHLAFDKKAREGKLRLVLARGIGKAFIAEDVPPAEITATLETAIAEGGAEAAEAAR